MIAKWFGICCAMHEACGFSTRELAEWAGGAWLAAPPSPVRQIFHDTRAMTAGSSLYVAIRGPRHDGHDFVADALAGGAAAALVDERFAAGVDGALPLLVVPDTRAALRALASGYRRTLGGRWLGVTGSAGKTTVKDLAVSILSETGSTASTRGNWNNDVGLPLSILAAPRDAAFGVFEVGMSHPGEIAGLRDLLQPHGGILTCVGAAHLEAFPSEEAIAAEKASLFSDLGPDAWAVMGRDERWGPRVRQDTRCRWITVATDGQADYVGVVGGADAGHLHVRGRSSGETADLPLTMPGAYFRRDVLLATAAARQCGASWSDAAAGLEAFTPSAMRWNRVTVGGVALINDAYNANPLSMAAALEAFEEMAVEGRRWLVLGAMLELGEAAESAHRALGAVLAPGPWEGLFTVGTAGQWIAEGAVEAGMEPGRVVACEKKDDVAGVLDDLVRPGDAVLFKASRGEALEEIIEQFCPVRAGVRGM